MEDITNADYTHWKALEKQIKTIEDQGKKQAEALKVLSPAKHQHQQKPTEGIFAKNLENNEIKNQLNEIKRLEEKIDRNYLKYEKNKDMCDF